jgi:dihydrofolate synthase/folylpolyglutamate synthase
MTYRQTLDFLFSQLPAYHRIGKAAYKNNLDNSIAFDEYLGHPHREFMTIHVAGTNGKGSVSHMLASVLQECGYKTGLYTSPHLKDFRERIRIDGQMIPEDEVAGFVEHYRPFIEKIEPSFFEMTVAMAFDHFRKNKVDIAVIEVGLGGRLDSTNIINPVISVITNIGHDHMDLLGDTLSKVAGEKAGIIKKNIPVVISETQAETRDAFLVKAREMASPIEFADRNYSCVLEEPDEGARRKYILTDLKSGSIIKGTTVLGGDYQSKNIPAVYQTCSMISGKLGISVNKITEGIKNVIVNTGFSGRWQIIGHDPLMICDTGHNKEGLEYVTAQINRVPMKALHMVIGFVNDKDLTKVLPLLPLKATYYFTKASVARALNENTLMERAAEYGLKGSCYSNVKEAIEAARKEASPEDMIFIGGSTFIVADAL